MNDESYVGLLTLYTRYPSEESGFRAGGADLHQFTIAGLITNGSSTFQIHILEWHLDSLDMVRNKTYF